MSEYGKDSNPSFFPISFTKEQIEAGEFEGDVRVDANPVAKKGDIVDIRLSDGELGKGEVLDYDQRTPAVARVRIKFLD